MRNWGRRERSQKVVAAAEGDGERGQSERSENKTRLGSKIGAKRGAQGVYVAIENTGKQNQQN